MAMTNVFHYTDQEGWNAVRSQKAWRFKATQPKDPSRPFGVYFTDIEPTASNLRTLFKRIRVPKAKQQYVFWFVGTEGLSQLNGGRGRDKRIFFSPIGSGQGVLNPNNIRICLEYLKDGDPDYPVIVDAGVGTASDVTIAMELGVDGVLLNTGIAHAADPLGMAVAMKHAIRAGRLAYLSGRIPKRLYATASSSDDGTLAPKPR